MKAILQHDYGSSDVFTITEIEKQSPKDNEVLVRVHAASLHAGDAFIMRGTPYLTRLVAGWPKPKNFVPGRDMAGRVETVGSAVTRLQPGDEVFAESGRACAEYVCAPEETFMTKPSNVTFEQAAALGVSAITALQGLRDAGKLNAGQKVLINGAAGGVGTYAVQIAKAMGAEVTGVCSTRNVEMVRTIGADHVIDYTQEDFTQGEDRYDLILDNVGNRSFADCRRVLTPQGKHLPNTGNAGLGYILSAAVRSIFVGQQGGPFLASPNKEDLATLKTFVEEGKITPIIDRVYPLSETAEAFRYLDKGHAQGKVVISIASA